MPNNVSSCQHHQKRPKNAKLWRTCQTPFFHAKQLQKRPNFWNLALKMPTWQPCWQCTTTQTGFTACSDMTSQQWVGKIRACHFPCLEAHNADKFHKYVHGNIFYQIPSKNRIWWFSCQLTFNACNTVHSARIGSDSTKNLFRISHPSNLASIRTRPSV